MPRVTSGRCPSSWAAPPGFPATEPTTLFQQEGNFAPNYSFMTQAAEVAVDLNTGKIKLLKMVSPRLGRHQPMLRRGN
jgi:CO/xanthine dehydrogenase Mo-binding subunit